MDPELPGSEKPGAIYEYIESKKDKKKYLKQIYLQIER